MFSKRTMFSNVAPATDRRSRKQAAKAEVILETALTIVEAGGIEALTIQRLAAELDCVVSAVYRYFPSMSALHAELQRRIVLEYDAALARVLAEDRSSALSKLVMTAHHYFAWFLARPAHLAIIATSLSDPRRLLDDELAARVFEPIASLLARVTSLFEDARTARELSPGDAPERTLIYWSMLQGVMQLRKLDRLQFAAIDHDALLPHALRTVLVGFGADPRRVRRAEKGLSS